MYAIRSYYDSRGRCGSPLGEEVPEADLSAPPRQQAGIVHEGLRGAREVEDRSTRSVESDQGEGRSGRDVRNLAYAPAGTKEVSDIEDIHTQLEIVASPFSKSEVLHDPQVDVAVPGIEKPRSLGDLAPMLSQVLVLFNEGVECGPLSYNFV